MRHRNIAIFSAAALAGLIAGSAIGPRPAAAVARELIELQRDVTTLLQGQKDLSVPNDPRPHRHEDARRAVQRQCRQLNSTMSSCRNPFRTCRPIPARVSTPCPLRSRASPTISKKSNRASANSISSSSICRTPCRASTPKSPAVALPAPAFHATESRQRLQQRLPYHAALQQQRLRQPRRANPAASSGPPPAGAPSADTLYSNGLRDITSGKYDLARTEFQDYLRYYGNTDLAGNAQFYLGEIAYSQKNYDLAVAEYDKVLTAYPHSFKVAPARLKKALANIELGQKATGVRELREIVKRYPGTEEDRRARAKLKEMGASVSAS